ncbi:CU044_5270 family protein [Nonomuraea sp. NPDC000554]|uniref:CU044_5270 family protein n=1 Tax=Nonomuraea sp. NPDC000554 TaxID=3154259 RepID=UPI003325C03B
MDTIKDFRRNTPPMTAEAESAARARLLKAVRGVETRPRRRRLGWRLAVAGVLAVTVGTGVVVLRGQPAMTPVASVRELGERAARAAEDTPGFVASPGQWLYIKERQAPYNTIGADLSKRTTFEQWTSVDGKQVAWEEGGKLLIQGTHPGISAADLAKPPVTSEGVLGKIRAVLEGRHFVPTDGPMPPMDEQLFQAVYQLMGEQALSSDVRAALFRGLHTIPGVTVTQDVEDADGRRGVAFSYTGDWTRYDLILDPGDYRFLGTYGVTVKDKTMTYTSAPSVFVKAGTPLTLTAQLETKLVDKPGQR